MSDTHIMDLGTILQSDKRTLVWGPSGPRDWSALVGELQRHLPLTVHVEGKKKGADSPKTVLVLPVEVTEVRDGDHGPVYIARSAVIRDPNKTELQTPGAVLFDFAAGAAAWRRSLMHVKDRLGYALPLHQPGTIALA